MYCRQHQFSGSAPLQFSFSNHFLSSSGRSLTHTRLEEVGERRLRAALRRLQHVQLQTLITLSYKPQKTFHCPTVSRSLPYSLSLTYLCLDFVGRLVRVSLWQQDAASSDVLRSETTQQHAELIARLGHLDRLAERLQAWRSVIPYSLSLSLSLSLLTRDDRLRALSVAADNLNLVSALQTSTLELARDDSAAACTSLSLFIHVGSCYHFLHVPTQFLSSLRPAPSFLAHSG